LLAESVKNLINQPKKEKIDIRSKLLLLLVLDVIQMIQLCFNYELDLFHKSVDKGTLVLKNDRNALFRGLPLLSNAIFGGSPRISFAFSHTNTHL